MVEFVFCEKVNVSVKMGTKFDTCYKDSFPVWWNGRQMYMDVHTKTLMTEPGLSRTPCNKKNLPILRSNDGQYIIMDGSIRIILLHFSPFKLLDEQNLLFEYKWSDSEPEYYYTHEDISAWRDDLLIQTHQRAITNHITREICHRIDGCYAQTYTDDNLVKNTLAGFLKELSPMSYVQEILTKASYIGGLISLILTVLMLIKTVIDILVNLCRGRTLKRIIYILMCFHLFVHEQLVDPPQPGLDDEDVEAVRPGGRRIDVAPFPPRR